MIEDNHVFKGLSMDTHPSRQSKEFLIDAYNIRINNSQDGDLWSITNMRGTEETNIQFQGKYVGHCVIDKYLVVFTVDGSTSYIYRVEYKDNNYIQSILFKGDLGFNTAHRIQALGVKENELLYKVYWIDDLHQPRVIIITLPELREIDIEEDYTKLYQLNQFDFSPAIDVFPSAVTVNKLYGSGVFTPGTIQYAFTYYNKYAQETNIFYTTPLYYISAVNRAESADKTVANSFSITIEGLDTSYDYLRVYSIHRTSLDATPEVKQLPDIYIRDIKPANNKVTTIDSGTEGSTVDPTQLLYIGGRAIIANTIASKDNTLFLGDLTLIDKESKIRKTLEGLKSQLFTINNQEETITKEMPYNSASYYFNSRNSLNTSNSAKFKTNETYRIGVQVQLSNGQWLQPIFLKDEIISSTYPNISLVNNKYQVNTYTKTISFHPSSKVLQDLRIIGIRNIRACVVYPSAYNREIICQGVLNPTVYNGYSRSRNSPFVQSSWFFRAQKNNYKGSAEQLYGGDIEFRDNYALRADRYGWEIQSMQGTSDKTIADITDAKNDIQNFYIDSNIVTLNSPDIEFNDNIINYDFTNTKLRIVGYVSLGAVYGDINLDTSTPVLGQDTAGFLHIPVGYNLGTDQQNKNNGGYVSQYSYEDVSLNKDYNTSTLLRRYQIYPFQRSGSVNNDVNRPVDKGTRSAVLQTKVISNLKFFDTFKSISNFTVKESKTEISNLFNIGKPQVFNSNEVSILKLDTQYGDNHKVTATYEGNIDTLVTTKKEYNIKVDNGINLEDSDFNSSKDPIRMKYKSTPHLMFNLTGTSTINSETGEYIFSEYEHLILPSSSTITNMGGTINYPDWLFNGNPEDNMTDDFKQESSSDFQGELSVVGLVIQNDTQQEQLVDYIGKENIYCQYEGNWVVGNVVYNTESKKYIIEPVVQGDPKIFKIATPTNIIKSWYDSHTTLFEGVNTIESDSIVRVVDRNVYVKISKEGNIEKSVINSSARVQDTNKFITVGCTQPVFEDNDANQFLLVGEIVREVPNKYGGTLDEVLQQQLWFPASDPVPLAANATIQLKYGDTWYQRYDCLKTYPYTNQDENQIVEVGSFMCETYTNLDGRYDKNIDQLSGLYFNPTNFNQINKVYSQQDNFFKYRILEEDFYKINNFSNQITWTLQKGTTDNTDPWTNITLAGILDLDGTYGKVTSLNVLNDNILCFQERALNRIDFNSRVQVQTSDGTPIEIANSKKVDGSRIISTGIGCNDKFSIEVTPNGIYFIDSISKDAYLFTGELKNLSASLGVSSWFKNSKNTVEPYYDSINRELYFKEVDAGSIYYSEDLGQFISRVSSIKAKVLFNFNNKFCSIDRFNSKLWENNIGDYNSFYGIITPSNITFISNDKYTYTKIFDTIEVRGNVFNEDSIDKSITNESPIYSMTVSNNYQYGSNDLDSDSSFIKKKFNIWRLNIPRNKGTRQRIRDQWAKITLSIIPAKFQNSNSKVVINDVSVKYTV